MAMARRRVFHTKVECIAIKHFSDVTKVRKLAGYAVVLEKSAVNSEIAVVLDGAVVGHLDDVIGPQVALAIDRGQSFTTTIEESFDPYANYTNSASPAWPSLSLKVEYLLEKGLPPIEIPKPPLGVHEHAEYPPKAKSFFAKVVGVTYEGRQQIISRCSVGERLTLVRDPSNPFDSGAIKVIRLNGEQLGFLSEFVSRGDHPSGLAFHMDHGCKYQCRISALTGQGRENLGVNIEITDGEFDSVYGVDISASLPHDGQIRHWNSGPQVDKENSALGWAVLIFLIIALVLVARGCG